MSAFWLAVHDSLRAHGGQVGAVMRALRQGEVSAAEFPHIFVPQLNQFLQHLEAHHQIEDGAYFPKFRALDPRMVVGFDLLETDHGVIHEALLASVESANGLLSTLTRDRDTLRLAADRHAADADRLFALLMRHLDDEEDLVIPAMLEHGERSVS